MPGESVADELAARLRLACLPDQTGGDFDGDELSLYEATLKQIRETIAGVLNGRRRVRAARGGGGGSSTDMFPQQLLLDCIVQSLQRIDDSGADRAKQLRTAFGWLWKLAKNLLVDPGRNETKKILLYQGVYVLYISKVHGNLALLERIGYRKKHEADATAQVLIRHGDVDCVAVSVMAINFLAAARLIKLLEEACSMAGRGFSLQEALQTWTKSQDGPISSDQVGQLMRQERDWREAEERRKREEELRRQQEAEREKRRLEEERRRREERIRREAEEKRKQEEARREEERLKQELEEKLKREENERRRRQEEEELAERKHQEEIKKRKAEAEAHEAEIQAKYREQMRLAEQQLRDADDAQRIHTQRSEELRRAYDNPVSHDDHYSSAQLDPTSSASGLNQASPQNQHQQQPQQPMSHSPVDTPQTSAFVKKTACYNVQSAPGPDVSQLPVRYPPGHVSNNAQNVGSSNMDVAHQHVQASSRLPGPSDSAQPPLRVGSVGDNTRSVMDDLYGGDGADVANDVHAPETRQQQPPKANAAAMNRSFIKPRVCSAPVNSVGVDGNNSGRVADVHTAPHQGPDAAFVSRGGEHWSGEHAGHGVGTGSEHRIVQPRELPASQGSSAYQSEQQYMRSHQHNERAHGQRSNQPVPTPRAQQPNPSVVADVAAVAKGHGQAAQLQNLPVSHPNGVPYENSRTQRFSDTPASHQVDNRKPTGVFVSSNIATGAATGAGPGISAVDMGSAGPGVETASAAGRTSEVAAADGAGTGANTNVAAPGAGAIASTNTSDVAGARPVARAPAVDQSGQRGDDEEGRRRRLEAQKLVNATAERIADDAKRLMENSDSEDELELPSASAAPSAARSCLRAEQKHSGRVTLTTEDDHDRPHSVSHAPGNIHDNASHISEQARRLIEDSDSCDPLATLTATVTHSGQNAPGRVSQPDQTSSGSVYTATHTMPGPGQQGTPIYKPQPTREAGPNVDTLSRHQGSKEAQSEGLSLDQATAASTAPGLGKTYSGSGNTHPGSGKALLAASLSNLDGSRQQRGETSSSDLTRSAIFTADRAAGTQRESATGGLSSSSSRSSPASSIASFFVTSKLEPAGSTGREQIPPERDASALAGFISGVVSSTGGDRQGHSKPTLNSEVRPELSAGLDSHVSGLDKSTPVAKERSVLKSRDVDSSMRYSPNARKREHQASSTAPAHAIAGKASGGDDEDGVSDEVKYQAPANLTNAVRTTAPDFKKAAVTSSSGYQLELQESGVKCPSRKCGYELSRHEISKGCRACPMCHLDLGM
eukprot:scpid16632/ scgid2098/ 